MSHMGDGGSRETPDSSPEAPGYVRVPLPIAAAGVIVVLAVLLAIGLYANANLRARGVILPTPATAVEAATTAVPTLAPATPLAASTAATPIPAAATATSPAAPTAAATSAPTQVVAVESATPTSAPVVGSVSPTPSPTVEPTLAAKVGAAYERYWQVRSQALLDLDKSHLSEAMGGDHLASTSNLIDQLIEENRAIQTSVDHDYQVVKASEGSAEIFDDYLSSSFYIDPQSLRPLSAPASDELRVLYQMINIDGVWKVIDSVRAD
jgi:hypothetical protein